MPKTLVFAKDDSRADDIVQVCMKKTDKDGNEYEVDEWVSTGIKPEDLLSQFRTAYFPRIAITVDMIATSTDVRPLEIVVFMRAVKSRTMFEQMKARGARAVTPTELQTVTPRTASSLFRERRL